MRDNAPKRRWFQWSLRTLFVVVTACAVLSPAIPSLVEKFNSWRQPEEFVRTAPSVLVYTTPYPEDNRPAGLKREDPE